MSSYDVALESYRLVREAGADHLSAISWVANEDRETSFRIGVVGDDGEAFDPAQHHIARINAIAKPPPKGFGVDLRSAPHDVQIKGIIWEMKEGGYKHVWPQLLAASTLREKATVLVQKYEQSGNQPRDINRQTALADYWMARIPDSL